MVTGTFILPARGPFSLTASARFLEGFTPAAFSAELVLLRGAGSPDVVPRHESRLARAVALAYGRPQPPASEEIQRISENWRPYRTWTTVLLRAPPEGPGPGRPRIRGRR